MKFKDLIQLLLALILLTFLGAATLMISYWDEYPDKDPFSSTKPSMLKEKNE